MMRPISHPHAPSHTSSYVDRLSILSRYILPRARHALWGSWSMKDGSCCTAISLTLVYMEHGYVKELVG